MKMFCESLRKYAMEIINFKKKKMKLLISEQQKPYENLENCYICQEKPEGKNMLKIKNIVKVGTIVIIQENM